MTRARDLLDRLRPVGAPGAATPAGVPTDRRAELSAELQPVFAALVLVEEECDRLRGAAAREETRRREEAARRAADIVARARAGAEAERAAAATAVRGQADAEATELQARAEQDAQEVRRGVRSRLPGLVTALVDRVRVDVQSLVPGAGDDR